MVKNRRSNPKSSYQRVGKVGGLGPMRINGSNPKVGGSY